MLRKRGIRYVIYNVITSSFLYPNNMEHWHETVLRIIHHVKTKPMFFKMRFYFNLGPYSLTLRQGKDYLTPHESKITLQEDP